MYSFTIRSARKKRRMRIAATNLALYGTAHAIVDAACAALVMSHLSAGRVDTGYFVLMLVLYNALAFATQPLIGLISDKLKISYETAVAGCILSAVATLFYTFPMASIGMAGIGNALFHVGGGITSLNLFKGKAAAPGIFVAPGAFGLMVGILIGKSGGFVAATFVFLLLCCGVGILLLKQPHIDYSTTSELSFEPYYMIMLLLLTSVSIRSLIGFVVNFSWKSDKLLLVCLTLAVVLGKALGGLLGDLYGWRRVSVIGLLLSAPLIAFGGYPIAGILGMFLFNMTMPITLTAVANLLPGYPGFAFGMTTLALFTGVLVTYFKLTSFFSSSWAILGIIIISAIILNKSLELYFDDSSKIKVKEMNMKM